MAENATNTAIARLNRRLNKWKIIDKIRILLFQE
jgi:hypothetical protein